MLKQQIFKRLQVQIAFFYFIASLVTVVLIGFILYYSISGIVLNETLKSTRMAVDKSGNAIEAYVDKMKDLTKIIAENPSTIRYLSVQNPLPHEAQDINRLIDTVREGDLSIVSIIVVGKEGQLISNESSLDMRMSDDMMKEPWYLSAIDSGTMPTLTSARMQGFDMDKMYWVISLSREIKDHDGENLGVLVVDFKYSVIEDYLKDIDLGIEGYAFILNSQNEVVYHEDTRYFEDEIRRNNLIEMSAMTQGYDPGMNRLIYQYNLKNSDWTLVGLASLDGLSAIRQQLVETIFLVGLVGLGILVMSATFIAGRITNPIKKLEAAMTDIEDGLKAIVIDEHGCYEAQSLARHYNDMIIKIKVLMTDIAQQEKSIRSYELNVLHSQINPHFLYNTLDTIVWMGEFGDGDKVVEITKALARFFRLSLSGGSATTTIAGEVDHVRQYLFIQKVRYGDQLSYTIQEEEVLSDIVIPKIILQPIVENAIYHGIRKKDTSGQIDIRVFREVEDIILEVQDNGCGFDTSNPEEPTKSQEVKLGGVGIQNVDQRIKLYYGKDYGLTITSDIGQGTLVRIRIHERLGKEKSN
ncbi:MAG: sensor histidine kinase [Firmicutes bacterium HGW-Firmicutes-3]|jgi:two-component system sensor histidine kinase YesM|nr:MAG: sensor histidine kinase [Firmicutes bacterium HGW-Firmicutes-3]